MECLRILLGYFTPESLRDDPEGSHRARLVTGLAMLGGLFGSVYTVFYLGIGHIWGAAIIVACTIAMVLVPFFMRATGRLHLAANLHALIWTLGFCGLGAIEGGINGHAIAWLACGVPLLGLVILERRAALIWCSLCFLATLVFCALYVAQISLPLAYPAKWHPLVTAAGYIGLAIFVSLLGLMFESSRKSAFRAMQIALYDLSKANERSQTSERFVQRIADTTPGLIYMFDLADDTLVYANQRLIKAFGLVSNARLKIKVRDLKRSKNAPELGRVLRESRKRLLTAKDGDVIEMQYEFNQGDNKSFWVCQVTVFSRTPADKPLYILGLAEDVTERKWTEQANRAKDQFLAVLSHELRTPLTPVLATVSAMEGQKDLPVQVRADLSMIQRNVEIESKLIDDLLDVTKISHGKVALHREVLDSHACLQTVLEIAQSEIETKRLDISLDLKANRHHVRADPVRFRQVLWNLLRNAIKFTPEKGRISLRTSNHDETLILQITDTGIGIDPDVMPRIFDAFEQAERTKTRRYGGIGLGLSIAKAIVELHHGRLTAFSEGKNTGATFTLELATVSAEAKEPQIQAAPTHNQAGPGRILLVEDHPDTLRILSRLLRNWGYTVTGAGSVRKGLECSEHETFDVVISDLGLPDGSGLDLIRQIKEHHELHGIALSGYGTDEDIRECMAAGFEQHLAKPVSSEALHTAIERVLSEAV